MQIGHFAWNAYIWPGLNIRDMQVLDLGTGKVSATIFAPHRAEDKKSGAAGKNPVPFWADVSDKQISKLAPLGITDGDVIEAMEKKYPCYIEKRRFTSLVLFESDPSSLNFTSSQIIVFLFENFIATVNASEKMEAYKVDRYLERHSQAGLGNVEHALIYLLGSVLWGNSRALGEIETVSDKIEQVLSVKDAHLNTREVFRLKRILINANRHFWKNRELVFDLKNSKVAHFDPSQAAQQKLDSTYNSLIFDINTAETLKEILSDTLDVYHAIISNRINKTIRHLTFVTVILTIAATISAFPNTIATIFGIPYLPFKPDSILFSIGSYPVYPWEFIIGILIFFSAVPAILFYIWWKKISKTG